jgi:peptidyl-prolyl cis-trans isomerase D
MLTALRRLAATWVAKALFVLLVFSFGIWGVGDMVRNFYHDTAIAKVGSQEVDLDEAQPAMRRELQRLSRTAGPQFEADPRLRRLVAEQAVQALVNDRVLRIEEDRMRIATPDAALVGFIHSIPAFRGSDGNFSRPLFESFLRSNDLTEQHFLTLVRADLSRQQLTNAVRAGATPPAMLAERLYRWVNEQRAAEIVALPLAQAPEPAAPDVATLRRYHDNNSDRFSTPEYREATVAVLTAALISREIQVSEEEIAQAYEQRRSQYETPEKRVLEQVLVQDEDKAKEIAAAWRGGASFADISSQAEAAEGQALELGAMDRSSLPFPALADAAFSTPAGGVTDPVHTDFGWHVLKVTSIEAPTSRPLSAVHDELRNDLASERAADLAFERANKVEDALAGGATLDEVAKQFNLGLAHVRTDSTGHAEDGKEVELPVVPAAREAVLRSIFSTDRGAPVHLAETQDVGFLAVQVNDIVPPALKPFESVRAEVLAAWTADAKRRAQEERATKLMTEVKGGKPLTEAAAAMGLGAREVGGLTRQPQQLETIPAELRAPLFDLALHDATMIETRDGFVVAQVTEITAPDPAANAAGLNQVKAEAEQSIARDLETQYVTALRNRVGVRINQRLMDQLAQP